MGDSPQYICHPSGNGPDPSSNNGGNSGTGTACCQVQGSNQCMPESSQWWCNESSGNCLGACNDSGDKTWGVPSPDTGATEDMEAGTEESGLYAVYEEESFSADDYAV